MADVRVWRTRLSRTLIAWMLLCVLLIASMGPLGERLADAPVGALVSLFVMLPVLPLLGWSVVATVQAPRRMWPTLPLMAGFCGSLLFAAEPLMLASARLYFAARQSTYERIIADVGAGRLASEGRRDGVSYHVSAKPYPTAYFRWGTSSIGSIGVLYDDYTCNDRQPPQSPTFPDAPAANGDDRPSIKNSRRPLGYYRSLSETACLVAVG